MKKYRLTDETMVNDKGVVLHRIDYFIDDKQGTSKGGWIESEKNLSQQGNCYVLDEAQVFGNAVVSDNACVYDNAKVFGNAVIRDEAQVRDNAKICKNAHVFNKARVSGCAFIYDNAEIFDNVWVYGDAKIFENAIVYGDAKILDCAKVYGNALVYDDAFVYGNAVVCGNAVVRGFAAICGNAIIGSGRDYIVFKNNWSSGRYFTWTKSNDMWRVGCFYGTGQELIEKAYNDSKMSGDCYKLYVEFVEKLKQAQQ